MSLLFFLKSKSTEESPISGELDASLGTLGPAGTGTVLIQGSLSQSFAVLTVVSTGTVAITGNLSQSLGSLVVTATGTVTLTGELGQPLGLAELSGSGNVTIEGELNQSLASVSIVASGKVLIQGLLNKSHDELTLTATGAETRYGVLTGTLDALTLTGDGTVTEAFEYHLAGRTGVSVAQKYIDLDYPLILPSPDVRYLIADSSLVFDQPSDYGNHPEFLRPFYIYWLSGFGDGATDLTPGRPVIVPEADSSSSSSSSSSVSSLSSSVPVYYPSVVHGHDIVIVDKIGNIVFDSTNAGVTYNSRSWSDWLQLVTWQRPDGANLTIAYHTAWSPNSVPEPQIYSVYFFPQNAQLDERVLVRLAKRVKSLTVLLDNIRGNDVEFLEGYNTAITRDETVENSGGRRSTRVVFNATAGAGLGIFPGCDPEPLTIRTLNGSGPDDFGNAFLTATDCLWLRQPTTVLESHPIRLTSPNVSLVPGSIPTPNLPHPNAGNAKNLPGWPLNDNPVYAHLQIGSDCEACCDCDDYVAVANYLNNTRNQYKQLGQQLHTTQQHYHENRTRWINQARCVLQYPLRIRLLPQFCPFLDVAVQFCNQSDDCKTNVELTINFTSSPTGASATEVFGYTFITGASRKPGRAAPKTERYNLNGLYPGPITFTFDNVWPHQSVSGRFRLRFNDCGLSGDTPFAITGCVTGTVDGEVIYALTLAGTPIPAQACETATLNCPLPDGEFGVNPFECDKCD